MAFVNEYVSDEDVQKYKLDDLVRRWKGGWIPPQHRHTWTFDRERDVYFKLMSSGREEQSNHIKSVLFYKGVELTVGLVLMSGSSAMLNASPFRVIWDIEFISHPLGQLVPREEIIPVLKEALIVHGYRGIHRQIPNTVVEFNF